MFTGIIQSVGELLSSDVCADGIKILVNAGKLDVTNVNLGDSIAVNGACLTVTSLEGDNVSFDVSSETLSKCLIGNWTTGQSVNLELALTLETPIGGHLVSGHVDGVATLHTRRLLDDYTEMVFETNGQIGKFLATKGSATVDGVSLTTNTVWDEGDKTLFKVMLVPHTLENTTLDLLQEEMAVHLEIDLIARYLQRLTEANLK